MQVAFKLYLAWLVPSTLSFVSSSAVVFYILVYKPTLRKQLFHQLTVALATADMIQSGNWFADVKYSAPYSTCAVMEYFLQVGTLFKAFLTIIICGVALYVIRFRKQPSNSLVFTYGSVIMLIPCIALTVSVSLSSARLYCDVNIEKYSQAPYHEKVSTLAYWLCFTFFVYLCAVGDISFLYLINRSLTELGSSLTSNRSASCGSDRGGTGVVIGDKRKAQMSLFIDRLKCYPFIFVLGWIPDSLTLLWILISGDAAIGLRCIANASAGSTGWAMAAAYFYYQFYASEVTKSSLPSSNSRGRSATTQSPLVGDSTSASAGNLQSDYSISDSPSDTANVDNEDTEVVNSNAGQADGGTRTTHSLSFDRSPA